MARPQRIEYPGALYHVTSRGNGRADIFLDAADRSRFLDVLADVIEQHGWLCHAYCLMTNHYHLVLETPQPNLSRGMRQLNGLYAQRFHRRHGSSGHLFQARFWAIIVERDAHLLELARYLVLNPVRAGLAKGPADWPWSSYRAAAGLEAPPAWLHLDAVHELLASNRAAAQEAYGRFVAEGAERPWSRVIGGMVLGSPEFAAQCRARLGRGEAPTSLPRSLRQPTRPPLAELLAGYAAAGPDERNHLVRRAHLEHDYTLTEIADALDLHRTTVSRRIRAAGAG